MSLLFPKRNETRRRRKLEKTKSLLGDKLGNHERRSMGRQWKRGKAGD